MINSQLEINRGYEIKSIYDKFSNQCLVDNSYFEENERISIADNIWHKILDLIWFLNYEEKTENNINIISKLNDEISSVLKNLITKIKIILY